MSSDQFSVLLNGHPTTVSVLENDVYSVQVTYKPVNIQLKKNEKEEEVWVDLETQQTTYLSTELGKLITAHLCES
ncbi:MAG TPA: hypothetical protein VLJ41_16790 [Segetibacter sp.]|nr:hypothetical protein [Segetibacter sp.]